MAGIYIHIPFCKSKCVYCAFYSVVSQRDMDEYISALIEEIKLKNRYIKNEKISTIYFGGGTPSILQISDFKKITNALYQNFDISELEEFTVEANPEQLTKSYCEELKSLGANRLSIGVQSFDDNILALLGRRHNSSQALQSVNNAKDAGFDNVSIDLIYGINERDDANWERELDVLFSLPVSHFSAYSLTLEENSLLYRKVKNRKHAPLDEELAARQYELLAKRLHGTGFKQYEVSNFAKNGYKSEHNSAYWFGVPYLGLGAAAHSYNGNSRSWNASNLKTYLSDIKQHKSFSEEEILTDADKFNEYTLLRLRTSEGIVFSECEELFGKEKVEYLQKYFDKHIDNNFYTKDDTSISLTSSGLWFADGIASNAFWVY